MADPKAELFVVFYDAAPINRSISLERKEKRKKQKKKKNIPPYSNVVLQNVCDVFCARK